jgi:recombination protein RecA
MKSEVLSTVLGNIERCYGKGSILKLGEAPKMNIETFSSGCLTLDNALGGGYPRGRVIEIYGPESSGKTTLALHAIAEMQRMNGTRFALLYYCTTRVLGSFFYWTGTAAFIDAEHALDPVYARNLGVKVDDLLVSQVGQPIRLLWRLHITLFYSLIPVRWPSM